VIESDRFLTDSATPCDPPRVRASSRHGGVRAHIKGPGTPGPKAHGIGFLLLTAFPIYALILATESLRVANQHSGHRLFDWQILSVDGGPVRAGSVGTVASEESIRDVASRPAVIVCARNRPTLYLTKPLLDWLRRLARQGTTMGAIDTGVFALAAADLLDGHRITLHWDAIRTFRELSPEIDVVEQLFVADRERLTCAGGIECRGVIKRRNMWMKRCG
jgi:AraC family carnitine catabolism transcriptional activator